MPAKRALSAALALLLVAAIPARATSMPTITVIDSINPGSGSSEAMGSSDPVAFGDYLYFTADDGTHGRELWRTNGTTTTMVKDINTNGANESYPQNFFAFGDYLYFSANDGTSGYELWRTDGTASGTTLVKGINETNTGESGSYPCYFTALGEFLYFNADDGTNGGELWRTDGTEAGTTLVRDIRSGANGSSPSHFTALNGALYFGARDEDFGVELWRTDGTALGTTLVKDINDEGFSWPEGFVEIGGYLFFMADGYTQANQLWRTDGTEAGTTLIADVLDPNDFTAFGGYLYFAAETEADGYELWRTDGTEAGTELFLDINDGAGDSYPYDFTVVGDLLYFHANDGTHGNELWATNGSLTVLAYDMIGGASDADPDDFTAFGDWLYFQAETGNEGEDELWRSNGEATERVPFPLVGQSLSGPEYRAVLVVAGGRLYMSAASTLIGNEFAYLDDSLPPTNRDGSLWTVTLVILAGLTAAASIGLRLRGARRA